eukprot:COSAG03_NODE_616_length_6692_cov_99.388594_5_plen_52_part_00
MLARRLACIRSEVSTVSPHMLAAPPKMNGQLVSGISPQGSKSYVAVQGLRT